MAKYSLIISLGIRELEIDLRGVKVKVTERLDKDPKPVQEVRAKVVAGRQQLRELVASRKASQGQTKTKTDEEAETEALETMAQQLDFALENDDRLSVCRAFNASVISIDLTDDDGVPMPLEVDALYASEVPTELLQMVLDALREAPLAPK